MRAPKSLYSLRCGLIVALASTTLFITSCDRIFGNRNLNRTVVKVNEKELSAEDFAQDLANRLKGFNSLSAKDVGVINQAKNSVVQDFIVKVLTQEWAQKNEIFVRREQLDAEIQKTRQSYPDDPSFRKAIAEAGMSFEDWEERLKSMLLERMVIEKLRASIAKPTSTDIQNFYNAHKSEFAQPARSRMRQIVTMTEESAKKIQEELRKGRKFPELAQKFSVGPEAAQGGDLGWIEKGTLDVFDQALKLGAGQRSNIMKSSFGFHLIEVTAKQPAKTLTLQEVENQVSRTILREREQALYSKWLEEQVLKAKVFKDEEFLKQMRVQTRGS